MNELFIETRRCDICLILMYLINDDPRLWACSNCGSIHQYPAEPWEDNAKG